MSERTRIQMADGEGLTVSLPFAEVIKLVDRAQSAGSAFVGLPVDHYEDGGPQLIGLRYIARVRPQ